MKPETVAQLIGAGAYWALNKKLHRRLGGDANVTLFLTDMMDKFLYFKTKEQLDEDGGFFNTGKNVEADTALSPHIKRKCIATLCSAGLIKTKLKGVPAKLWFYIDFEKIMELMESSSEETKQPVVKELNNQLLKNLTTSSQSNQQLYNNTRYNNTKSNKFSKENNRGFEKPKNYSKEKTRQANQSSKIKSRQYKRQSSRQTVRQVGINHIPNIIKNEWNSNSTVTTHRIEPGNKTYENIKELMLSLFNGSFSKGKYWDKDWIKTIPEDLLKKKWSVDEVRKGVQESAKYSMAGYWPLSKSVGFKKLSTILYNPKTGKSMFLQAVARPPELLNEVINNNDNEFSKDDYICGMQEVILEKIDPEQTKSFSMKRFEKIVKEIKSDYEKIDLVGELKYDAGSARDYAALYGEFISRAWKAISPDQIGPSGACYQKFQAYIRQEYYQ